MHTSINAFNLTKEHVTQDEQGIVSVVIQPEENETFDLMMDMQAEANVRLWGIKTSDRTCFSVNYSSLMI